MNLPMDAWVVDQIRELRRAGLKYRQIADRLKMTEEQVQELATTYNLRYLGPSTFWTVERSARAVHLSQEGRLTASQIAADLGCTRNAVIGRLHRLGVSWNKERRRGTWPTKKTRPRPPKGRYVAIQSRDENIGDAPTDKVKGLATELRPQPVSDAMVEFRDLEWRHCRWPIAGEPGPHMMCCGAAREDDTTSYCGYHRAQSCQASKWG